MAHRSHNMALNVLQEDVPGWMMAPKRHPCLNPWNLWMFLIGYQKKDITGMLPLGILSWGDYPGLFGYTLSVITCIIIRGRQSKVWHTGDEKAIWLWKERLEWCGHMPRNVGNYQKPENTMNRLSPRASGRHMDLPAPSFKSSRTVFTILASQTIREQMCVVLSH